MGKGTNISIDCFGVKTNFMNGNDPNDNDRIRGTFEVIGWQKVKHIYDQSPELQQVFDDEEQDFPENGNEN